MKELKVKLKGLPEMTESDAARYVLNKLRGRELFREKNARAKKFLEALEQSQQTLLP